MSDERELPPEHGIVSGRMSGALSVDHSFESLYKIYTPVVDRTLNQQKFIVRTGRMDRLLPPMADVAAAAGNEFTGSSSGSQFFVPNGPPYR